MAKKYDIFETLRACDKHNFGFYDNLSEEDRKSIALLVLMRWMSAISDGPLSQAQLMLVNESVNRDFFDLSAYPDFQWRLLASCGLGTPQRHQWIPMQKAKKKGGKVADLVAKYWPEANSRELSILIDSLSKDRDSLEKFVFGCGLDDNEAQEIMDEYDGTPSKKSKSKRSKSRD